MVEVEPGITLRVVVEGEGPLVICLHGWPQGWYLYRNQIEPLKKAGFRVAVPDQRGYGGSSNPKDVKAYGLRNLCRDVVNLGKALGSPRFLLCAHDWGCIVAWQSGLRRSPPGYRAASLFPGLSRIRSLEGITLEASWKLLETPVNFPRFEKAMVSDHERSAEDSP